MEKLIELLNEYGKEYGWAILKRDMKIVRMDVQTLEWTSKNSDLIIISKSYGFIKWLVENKKIDLEKVKEKIGIPCFVWYKEGEISCVKDKEDYEQLLMLLSIQEKPIEFLVSILK